MITVKKFSNGFEYIEVSNAQSYAKIALQGAHIFEYGVHNEKKILWLSETAEFKPSVAIRGGIPICWPRFGSLDTSMPAHGFSRTTHFKLSKTQEINANTTELTLLLEDNAQTRQIWDYAFKLEVTFSISDTLSVALKTTNLSHKSFTLTEALHTYLSVSNIQNIAIGGLENKQYLDTLRDKKEIQIGSITIDSECDRVYENVDNIIFLKDKNKTITLQTQGASSAVIWNPWIDKGSRMSAMKADAYKEFVCIESANAFDEFITLNAGAIHILQLRLST